MIRLKQFDFHAPSTLEEAVKVLSHDGDETRILAGGTDLLVGMKHEVVQPGRVVWLGRVSGLREVAVEKEWLRIGAMCTLAALECDTEIGGRLPSLGRAIRTIASPQIRNTATIGGNLCLDTRCVYYDHSDFWRGALGYCLKFGDGICHVAPERRDCSAVLCSDLAPLLIALNASVRTFSVRGSRTVELTQLYREDGAHHLTLEKGELLAHVLIPARSLSAHSAHSKIRARGSIDFPIANAGVSLHLDAQRVCVGARIIVGAVHSVPVTVESAADLLVGSKVTAPVIDHAGEEAAKCLRPLPNLIESVGYRKKMAAVVVRRALQEAVRQA